MDPELYKRHAQLEDNHWWFKARRKIILAILQRFGPVANKNLAEIGCGTGGNLKFFSQYCKSIIGVDTSPHAVKHARQRVATARIILGEFAEALRSEWEKLDIILLADVIEHIDDDHAFIGALIKSMKPGCLLLITAPAHPGLWGPHDISFGHKRRYTKKTFHDLWMQQPVDELLATPYNCFLFPLIFIKRKLNSNANSAPNDLIEHRWFSNTLLYLIFVAERYWLKFSTLPWGCSYLALLRKI